MVAAETPVAPETPAPPEKPQRPKSGLEIAITTVSALLASLAGLLATARQLVEPFLGKGTAAALWGVGAAAVLVVLVTLFVNRRPGRWWLWVIPLVIVAAIAGLAFGAAIWSPEEKRGSQENTEKADVPGALAFAVVGQCTNTAGELTSTSGGFTPGSAYTVSVTDPAGKPAVTTSGVVDKNGQVAWRWPCAGNPPGRYTTELSDEASDRRTGPVAFTVSTATPATTQPTTSDPAAPTVPTQPSAPTTPTTVPAPVFAFTVRPGQEPNCADYYGTGTERPNGMVVVLLIHRPNDENWYSEKKVEFDGSGTWSADNVTVGDVGDTGAFIIEARQVTPAEAGELLGPNYVNKPVPHWGSSIASRPVDRGTGPNTC